MNGSVIFSLVQFSLLGFILLYNNHLLDFLFTQGSVLLPPGVTPVDIEPLPYADASYGHAAEVYDTGIASAVVGLRRAMHEQPGIMYDEYFSSEIAYETLKLIGIEEHNIMKDLGITGMVAHIGKGSLAESMNDSSIPTIVLRADMDALPIQEETDVPFKSKGMFVIHLSHLLEVNIRV